MIKRVAFFGFIFISGLVAGWILSSSNNNSSQYFNEERLGEYEFINPLLECEGSDGVEFKELKSFKTAVKSLIQKKLAERSSNFISVYFRDLNNGPWFGINEKEALYPASLFKVPIMVALLKQAEQDNVFLKKNLSYIGVEHPSNKAQYFKPSQKLVVGNIYSIENLIYRMITSSDNDSMDLLLTSVDPNILNSVYKDFRVETPSADNVSTYQISVKNYASFFRILFNASYLKPELSNLALSILNEVEFKNGLISGVPATIKVAHKFGERNSYDQKQLHDCGIVYYPNHPYLLCVMTRGNNLDILAKTIADISRLVYQEIYKQFK